MSKLAVLDDLLELYYQLNYHKKPEILAAFTRCAAVAKTAYATHPCQTICRKTQCADVGIFY